MKTYAIDFDGVIHRYSKGWADGTIYDPPMPGAIAGLRQAMVRHPVFIHTTREPEQVMPWLEGHGFNVTIDERCGRCLGDATLQELDADLRPVHTEQPGSRCKGSGLITFWEGRGQLLVTNRKLPAVAYLDDRAVRFTNWHQAIADLELAADGPDEDNTATWHGGHALVVEYGDEELYGRCQCGEQFGMIRPDKSLDRFGRAWERHVMTGLS